MDIFAPRLSMDMFEGHNQHAEEVNELLNILEPQLGEEIGGTITESTFVYGGYLELFYSIIKDKNDTSYKDHPLFKLWIENTRGYREVNIVDDNDGKTVLYKVPAFYSSKIMDYKKLEPIWPLLDNVRTRYENDNNYGINTKEQFLNKLLVGFQKAATEPNIETRMRWYNIFKTYMQPDGTFKIPRDVTEEVKVENTTDSNNKKELKHVDDDEWE